MSPIKEYFPKKISEVQKESYISGEKVTYPINNYKEFLIDCFKIGLGKDHS